MPILVASEGMSRIELFQQGELIDSINVHRYSREELSNLLETMGQVRDQSQTWEKIGAASKLDDMLNNWQGYNDIIATPEQKKAQDAAKAAMSEEL